MLLYEEDVWLDGFPLGLLKNDRTYTDTCSRIVSLRRRRAADKVAAFPPDRRLRGRWSEGRSRSHSRFLPVTYNTHIQRLAWLHCNVLKECLFCQTHPPKPSPMTSSALSSTPVMFQMCSFISNWMLCNY